MRKLYRRFISIRSKYRWGILWLMISLTGLVLAYTGYGIKIPLPESCSGFDPDTPGVSIIPRIPTPTEYAE